MLFLFFTMFFAFSGLYTYHGKISEWMNSGVLSISQRRVISLLRKKIVRTFLTSLVKCGSNSGGLYHVILGTFINSFMSSTRIAMPSQPGVSNFEKSLLLGDKSILCRISFLGDAVPSDMLCQMLKPSSGGRDPSSSMPKKLGLSRIYPEDTSIHLLNNC